MPTLALVSILCGGDLRSTVDFAIQEGFGAVELHGRHHSADDLTEGDIEFLQMATASHGITFNMHFVHASLPASHRASVQSETSAKFKRDVELVSRLGGTRIVLHSGMVDVPTLTSPEHASEIVRRESLRNLTRFIERAAPVAEASGVDICVENLHHHPGYAVQSYAELASVIDIANRDNVGVTLDVGHALIGDGLEESIGEFGDRIRHLHLNDAIDGVEHHEIGTGVLDFQELSPVITGDMEIQFATLEVGFRSSDGEGVNLRSREVLRRHYGDAID